MTPAPSRRWFRFSLRTLLAAVAVLAIVFGWVAWRLDRAREQGRVLADLYSATGVSFVGFDMPKSSPESLKTQWVFGHFFRVDRLEIGPLPHTPDNALKHLPRLPQLEKLKIESDAITDDGLRHLLGIKRLRVLGIVSAQLTDDGLLILGQMKQLQELAVESPRLTIGGIERLKRDLPHCQIKSFEMIDTVE
jgi:hypothetical protein